MQIERALISVSDKTGLIELAKILEAKNIEIISSGGTADYLQKNNIKVQTVESITEFPEMLDGRVKTLHPKIHAGILFDRDKPSHSQIIEKHKFKKFDLIIINLYPFEQTIQNPEVTLAQAIEQIDIGGPSLLRSAAKNHASVIVLSSPEQYASFLEHLENNNLTKQVLKAYAIDAFKRTCEYDEAIYTYLNNSSEEQINLNLTKVQNLRYGENPHQKGFLYKTTNLLNYGLDCLKQLSGKELSYNNWLDIDAAWGLINEFETEIPACAILKHNIPCGVALGENIAEAYEYAFESDPVSAFGGIVIVNGQIDKMAAEKMSQIFLEVIIAPSFSEEAMQILTQKKNLRLIELKNLGQEIHCMQYRSILGNGVLRQEFDNKLLQQEELKVVTELQPSKEEWIQLLFAFRVAKHVRSNAIVLVNQNRTVGICGGQTNRVSSVKIALEQASDLATGAILASDGFFPFADNIELAAQGRIKAIIQPGGSIRDSEVIEAANKYKIPMVFTNMRHFKH